MAGQQRPRTPQSPQPSQQPHSWRGQVITSGALDELDDLAPTTPQMPSIPRIPSVPAPHPSQPPRPHGRRASVHNGPPLSGMALEVAADFAEFMLCRTPDQLFPPDVLTVLSPRDLRAIRASLERIYMPALRLAGRLP